MDQQNAENTSQARPLADILLELKSARERRAAIDLQMADAIGWEANLKDEIRLAMESQGVKTFEGHGLQIQSKVRRGVEVTDREALVAGCAMAGKYQDFLKFDEVRAKKAALENDWPGVTRTETQYLAIVEVKS